jgi:hypothetical protein
MKKTIVVSIAVFSGIICGILLISHIFYYSEIASEASCLVQRNASSCLAAALTKMIEGNYADSYQYVNEGCVLGDAELCNTSGVVLSVGLNGYFDYLFAYALFDHGCDLGNKKSCSDRKLLTIEKDDIQNLIENCKNNNNPVFCRKAGEHFFYSKEDHERKKALEFLKPACSQLKDFSCAMLSIMFSEDGDQINAKQVYDQFTTKDFQFSNHETFLEIKAAFMLGNEDKTEKLIIEKTNETSQIVIVILKDPVLKKTAENKRLHEHYLSLLRALKQKNESCLISEGGVQ